MSSAPGLLPSPACGEVQGRGPAVDNELELAVGERLDAGDVGDVEALLGRAVGGGVGKEARPPPPQGPQRLLQLLAARGQRVHDAGADRAWLPGHDARPFQVPEPVSEHAGADAGQPVKERAVAARLLEQFLDDHQRPPLADHVQRARQRAEPPVAGPGPAGHRGHPSGLCPEAIRLAQILAALLPGEPEVDGLLALLLLTESRRASRTRPDGSLALLADQDRGRWDRALIEEGQAIVRRCLHRNQPGPYQIQAAINAVHADAATAAQTDWPQIAALYDQLLAVAPTPVVALNRAIAIGEVHGPAAALALVDELDLDNYHLFHATRADLLHRLGRNREAAAAYQRAASMAPTPAERDFLRLGGRASR